MPRPTLDDAEGTVDHLISLVESAPGRALRLGRALLAESEWRHAPSSGGGLSVLPPDPGAWVVSHGQRRRLAELTLPGRGTVAEARMLSAIHGVCCEAAAADERWEDVEEHARAGLASLHSLRRTSDAAIAAWVIWREMGLAHNALLAMRQLAGDSAATAPMLASHRPLLRQLQDYCARRVLDGAPGGFARLDSAEGEHAPIDALLRLLVAVAACAVDDPATIASMMRDEVLRTFDAALRCARRELVPLESPPSAVSSPTGPLDVSVAQMLEELLLLAAGRGEPSRRGKSADGEDEDGEGGDEAANVGDDAPPTKRARIAPSATDASTRSALLRCGSLVAGLLREGSRGEARAGVAGAPSPADLCLSDAALSGLAASAAVGARSSSLELRRVGACVLHDRAVCRAAEALSRGAAETATSSFGASPRARVSEDDSALQLLRAAERDAARAMALRAAAVTGHPHQAGTAESLDTDASRGEDVEAARACRCTRAVLLLALNRPAEAAALLGPSPDTSAGGHSPQISAKPPPSHVAMDCDEATVRGVLRECLGDTEGALEALQHAFAVGSEGGRAAALPLYNLVAHYDRTSEQDATLKLAEYFGAADFDLSGAALAGRPATDCLLVQAAANPAAAPARHDASAVLCPVAAQYLLARAHQRVGQWSESSAALRALLDNDRSLRPTLHAFGLDESQLLRSLALAMLHDGEHHELLELLRARGAVDDSKLADLVADAHFCEGEAATALELASVALEAAQQCGSGASKGGMSEELRARNNQACYLAANGRFAEAERELLAAVKLAPEAIEPSYNLAILRWDVGERRRAAEGWLRFRRWPLGAAPDYYTRLAEQVLPGRHVLPPAPQSAVSGEVGAASAATLDREALRKWADVRGEELFKAHWA